MDRTLRGAKFEREKLETKYLKKMEYYFKNSNPCLLIDDTLNKKEGKHIEETQKHFDHDIGGYILGHQYFTAILYIPFLKIVKGTYGLAQKVMA